MADVCPHCGGDPQVPQAAVSNCQRFNSTPTARTRCCGYGVTLVPRFSYELQAAPRNKPADSFGVTLNRDDC